VKQELLISILDQVGIFKNKKRVIDNGFSFGNNFFSNHCIECTQMSTIDNFKCNENQIHVNCSSCNKLLPKRTETNINPNRPQICYYCSKIFCGAYFSKLLIFKI
jgi:hypothetical protein